MSRPWFKPGSLAFCVEALPTELSGRYPARHSSLLYVLERPHLQYTMEYHHSFNAVILFRLMLVTRLWFVKIFHLVLKVLPYQHTGLMSVWLYIFQVIQLVERWSVTPMSQVRILSGNIFMLLVFPFLNNLKKNSTILTLLLLDHFQSNLNVSPKISYFMAK